MALMGALVLVVLAGVAFRKAGAALVWYDEVASILLAWLTFYGAALAALHRGHIGFPRLVQSLPERPRRVAYLLVEAIVIGFFLLVAWGGWQVYLILGGEVLVSLPSVPRRLAQSAVPIAALLYVIAELLAMAVPMSEQDEVEEPDVGGGPPVGREAGAT